MSLWTLDNSNYSTNVCITCKLHLHNNLTHNIQLDSGLGGRTIDEQHYKHIVIHKKKWNNSIRVELSTNPHLTLNDQESTIWLLTKKIPILPFDLFNLIN